MLNKLPAPRHALSLSVSWSCSHTRMSPLFLLTTRRLALPASCYLLCAPGPWVAAVVPDTTDLSIRVCTGKSMCKPGWCALGCPSLVPVVLGLPTTG
jgi:hypothetical protein